MADNKLLLHVCCGVCAANVIDELKEDYDLILYFYNPNIYPEREYIKRKEVIKTHAKTLNIDFIDEDYNHNEFMDFIKGFENEKEGGKRCIECFRLRLLKSFKKASALSIKKFTTTLTVSPHKKSSDIFAVAGDICREKDTIFLEKNFKKNDGFKKSITKAKEMGFYMQNYCGCSFSIR